MLEGLAASGLRAIRYAKEIEGIGKVVANDLDPVVVESMRRNIEFNGELAQAKVQPNCGDARLVMMQVRTRGKKVTRFLEGLERWRD